MIISSIDHLLAEAPRTAGEKLSRALLALEQDFGVRINLHDLAGLSQIDPETRAVLEPYLYHNNAFCVHLKKFPATVATCGLSKGILCRVFQHREAPFYGACYLGIEELRSPIRWNGKLLGFLCVGQFCSDREGADRQLDHYAAKYGLDVAVLKRLHRQVARPLDFDIRRFGVQTGILADYLALLWARFALAREHGVDAAVDAREHTAAYQITRTKAFVLEHLDQPLPLALLAAQAYCSPTHLSALFRKVEGKTLTEWILQVRLTRSQSLLDTTSMTITEVADACGFNDSNYFSRAFKARYGVSPKGYRGR